MKINRKMMGMVSLGVASGLLIVGIGYSTGQTSPVSPESKIYPYSTPAGLVVREAPMDLVPGEGTPPGKPEPGEATPPGDPAPGETPVQTLTPSGTPAPTPPSTP